MDAIPPHRLVAVCDILGFSDLIQTQPLNRVVDDILGWFRKALRHSVHQDHFPSTTPLYTEIDAHADLGVALFSDTVLLYARNDSDEAARQLINAVGWLIFETLMQGTTKIRAGISYGEAWLDRSESMYVGKAIVDAYQLERDQAWSGAALTETACQRVPMPARSGDLADWWVVPYSVPLKAGNTIDTLAVNWTWGMHRPDWRLRWSNTNEVPDAADWASKPQVCEKFMNTKAFHDTTCPWCKPR